MTRPLRIEYPGAYYHVMNRGLSRQAIFREDKDRERFFDLLGETVRLWKIEIYAYCLMENHYHLLVRTPQAGLARAMRHLGGIYTQRFNRAHGRDGPLLRGRYKAILIDAEEYFLAVVRYIHQNPIKAGMVSDIGRYRWSSHWAYLDKKRRPEWLNTKEVLSRFSKGHKGLMEYKEYMKGEVEKELLDYYGKQYYRPILGGKEFVVELMERLGDRARVEEEKPESKRLFRLELKGIVDGTARYYGKGLEELRKKRRGHENEARAMAMYLARVLGGYKLVEIGRAMGLERYSTVSSACLAMKQRIDRDRAIARRAKRIESWLLKGQRQT